MLVRMKLPMSGPRDGADWPPPGDTIEVPDTEGASLCAAGIAVPVAQTAKVEKAVAPEPEKRSGLTTKNAPVRRGRPPKNG